MSASDTTQNLPDGVKRQSILPAHLEATLVLAGNSGNKDTTPPTASVGIRETVAPRIQDAAVQGGIRLINALWRSTNKVHQVGGLNRQTKTFKNTPVKGAINALATAQNISVSGFDPYFAVGEYLTEINRTAANVAGACAIWVDLDVHPDKADTGKGYATIEAAREAVRRFCEEAGLPYPTHIVESGSGLHVYWVLDEFVEREVWCQQATKLKEIAKHFGFFADPSRTTDIASVMRLPGTMNHKYDPPRAVTLAYASDQFIGNAAMFHALSAALNKLKTVPVASIQSVAGVAENAATWATVEASSDTPPDLDLLASAMKFLDPDCDDYTWKFHRLAPLARIAREHPELALLAYALAKAWSSGELRGKPSTAWGTRGANGQTGAEAFEVQWKRFLQPNHSAKQTSVGSIYFHAKEVGWSRDAYVASKAVTTDKPQQIPNSQASNHPVALTLVKSSQAVKPLEAHGQVSKIDPLAAMQGLFGLINVNGKLCVFDRKSLGTTTQKGNAQRLVLSSRSDGALLITRALKVQFPAADDDVVLKDFFVSPQTVCYSGVDFHPTGAAPGYLNLWVGPTVVPKAGSWVVIQAFLLEVICNGVQANYVYLIAYIAHALQFPEEKPGVMVNLLGGQGIGKGTLARILQLIWSATFLQVSNVEEVVGNFNAALERAYIVFLDEALFAGNRRASDALKSLVTEPVVHINEKHQPSRQTSSFHRIFAASNSAHLKNTENDDRRDFSLRVSESRKGDHSYWKQVYHEIENGGVEAMVSDLLAMDLSDFNVRAKPHTTELLEQKLQSLEPIQRWWHEVLVNGGIDDDSTWPEFIATESVVTAVYEFSGGKMYRKISSRDVLSAFKALCPSATQAQKIDGLSRKRGLDLPPLEQARAEFDKYIGAPVAW